MGFDSIFVRPLTQLGKATIGWEEIGYKAEQFVEFYKKVTDIILKESIRFRADNKRAVLEKIELL